MKKTLVLLLALVLCIGLWGCKSKEAAAAEELITAIGTVSLDSAQAIEAAENAYAALSQEDKEQVENAAALEEARSAYEALVNQAQADAVKEQIAAMGEITLESGDIIAATKEAFDALTPEVQALVDNQDLLKQAEKDLIKLELAGRWYVETTRFDETGSNEWNQYQQIALYNTEQYYNECARFTYPEFDIEVSITSAYFYLDETGFYAYEDATESRCIGPWHLNEDNTALIVDVEVDGLPVEEYVFDLYEEDGFVKLKGNYPWENAFAFVHKRDVAAAFDAKYFYFDGHTMDYQEYFGDPVSLGGLYDENGQQITTVYDGEYQGNIKDVWLIPSKAYEKGLVYLDRLQYSYTFTYNGMNGRGSSRTPLLVLSEAWENGKLISAFDAVFVRADHVAKNYIDENGSRVVELTDGTVIRTYNQEYYDEINHIWKYLQVDYNDYIY